MPVDENSYSWSDASVSPSPMSLGYRLGLFIVALMMILLPAIYIGLCIAVGYGIYLYATDETFLLGYHQPGIAAYLGVILAGCIGLLFMIKPLFTRRKIVPYHLPVTRETQPELFQFIDEVCTRIGSPKPVRVYIDNQVNASASFENGLWGFLTNRLVLTIGLPLAQGLSVSQFGGVLAHEFGHFTQSAAMRLNYVIRSINNWFNRVIYERDSLDASLTAWTKRGNVYWMIMSNIAVGFIWVARKILLGLMMSGHAVSAYMMRQMEYDADFHEQQITGQDNFKSTFLRMRVINTGAQMAGNHLNETWKTGKLVDNLPLLTNHMIASIPAENIQAFNKKFEEERSVAQWHSTHPSDHQRIARGAIHNSTGVLIGDVSAEVLFANMEELSKKITFVDYTRRHNLKIKDDTLISTAGYLQDKAAKAERMRLMVEFFGGLLTEHRPIFPASFAGEQTPEEVRGRLDEVTNLIASHAETITAASAKMELARTERAKAIVAQTFVEIGVKTTPAEFGLADLKPGTISGINDSTTAEISSLENELAPFAEMAREKLSLSFRLAESYAMATGQMELRLLVNRMKDLETFLTAIKPISDILTQNRKPFFTAAVCVNNYQKAEKKKQAESLFEALAAELEQANGKVETIASQIKYPLDDGTSYAHLSAYFVTGNNQPGSMGQYTYFASTAQRFLSLYNEVMLEVLDSISKAYASATPAAASHSEG